jgi:hypothetical protein
MMRHARTTTYLRIPAARMACSAGVRRTGAQRLRERVVHAALVRVPVEFAADYVPKAPSGVVRGLLAAGVHIHIRALNVRQARARDGRQALARRLGLEQRIVLRAAVAVRAAHRECCTEFHAPRAAVVGMAQCAWQLVRAVRHAAAVPPGGLNVGTFASGPAVASTRRNAPLQVAGMGVRV